MVAAAGVELRRRGHGFMGCCPFHDDTTASLSVDGVPDRSHCFGCGASGDVIDFIQRLHGLTFPEALAHLQGRMPHPPPAIPAHRSPRPTPSPTWPPPDRAYEVNALAWAHYTRPLAHATAVSHLRRRRGIDVTALREQLGGPVVGHTGHGWTTLTDQLRDAGVSDDELLALDLAQPTRRGAPVDTLRDRLVVPVTARDGRIGGLSAATPAATRAPRSTATPPAPSPTTRPPRATSTRPPATTPDPRGSAVGSWISPQGVPVDLMVPEAVAGAGRRGVRVQPHDSRAMRRARGLEAALVDNSKMVIGALDAAADAREFEVAVAGAAALLVAKLHKIHDRIESPSRLDNKDAHDIYRLLRSVKPKHCPRA